eukprot:COSAG01_NODE_3214_length_6407_cov_5.475428_9_plen_108_part_00
MAAMPGRLRGHYPDLATRGRGHRHSDVGCTRRAVAGGGRRQGFFIENQCRLHAPTNTEAVWPWRVPDRPRRDGSAYSIATYVFAALAMAFVRAPVAQSKATLLVRES